MSEDVKREKFIKELKNKLNQKSHGSTKEEAVLLKAFKYFDLDNSGACSENEFIKTIAKVGVTNYSEEDIKSFFHYFDTNKSGQIDYKEFISILYTNKSLGYKGQTLKEEKKTEEEKKQEQEVVTKEIQGDLTKKEFLSQDPVENILSIIRNKLASRGVESITSLSRNFRIVDDNNSQSICFEEFKKSFNEIGLTFNDEELKIAFAAFDRDNSGEIDYDEFIRAIRGEMNEFRQTLVQKAFDILDINGSGEITFDEIKQKYNAKKHPQVMSGEKTEDEVLKEFMDTFQDTYNYLCGTESDNKITFEEFLEYYENVSMSIDDDEFFEAFMNNAWGLGEDMPYKNKKAWSNKNQKAEEEKEEQNEEREGEVQQEKNEKEPQQEDKNELQERYKEKFGDKRPGIKVKDNKGDVIYKLREELLSKEDPVYILINLEKIFKSYDDNRTKEIDPYDFEKSLHEGHLYPSEEDLKSLLEYMDPENKGAVNYAEFIRQLHGPMNKIRTLAVKEAFSKLDEDKCGITNINDIKKRINVNGHKDVTSGNKTEGEVYEEFINSFQLHHDNKVGFRNKKVFLDEFLDYYNIISMTIPDDNEFIYLVQNSWGINPAYSKLCSKTDSPEEEEVSYMHGDLRGKKVKIGAAAAPFGTDIMIKEEKKPKIYYNPDPYTVKEEETEPTPLDIIRAVIQRRGTRGIFSMRRAFKIADLDGSGNIDFPEFVKYCHDYRLGLESKDIDRVFQEFDKNKSGNINYSEFVYGLVGEMNGRRKKLIKILFDSFDKDKSGILDIDEIREVFNPKGHPNVINGIQEEDEVLAEFLDSLSYQFSLLSNKEEENKISFKEFLEYFNNLSFSIDDDDYFEEMIRGVFNLDERKPKKHGWKSIV